MKLPFSRKPEPGPPGGSPAAEFIAACDAADTAAAALREALERRRRAIGALSSVTALHGKPAVNAQVSSGTCLRAFARFGLGLHIGAPHVAIAHQQSFGEMARSIASQTAAARPEDAEAIDGVLRTHRQAAPGGFRADEEFA